MSFMTLGYCSQACQSHDASGVITKSDSTSVGDVISVAGDCNSGDSIANNGDAADAGDDKTSISGEAEHVNKSSRGPAKGENPPCSAIASLVASTPVGITVCLTVSTVSIIAS